MNKSDFFSVIADDPTREKVFVEIYYKNEEWVEISQEDDQPIIAFFAPPNGKYWEIPLHEALETIEKAKMALLN